jgi:hypothetical protein
VLQLVEALQILAFVPFLDVDGYMTPAPVGIYLPAVAEAAIVIQEALHRNQPSLCSSVHWHYFFLIDTFKKCHFFF